ncbi:hypothetical protein, partial [Streptomyces sp. NPDC056056]|uniref:hypothetical protein n=1 Tax=Streptomyces sp. NPDC056056 TaxID=3345698 RepID=UPI0035D62F6E
SSTGDTVLTYLTAEDIRGYRSVEDALDTDTDIGTVVAANEWRRRPDGFTHWIAELEVSEHDPQILLAALAALAVMRTLTGLLAPVGLCVLQLQDALSNLLAGTGWTTLIDGAPALNSRTLIDALHAGDFLEEHDADAAELIARAYRNGGFEDADENTEIVHSSQLTVPAAV